MAIKIDNKVKKVQSIVYNGNTNVNKYYKGRTLVWCRPATLEILCYNCSDPYIREYVTGEPSADSLEDSQTAPSTVYYGDKFYVGASSVDEGYGTPPEEYVEVTSTEERVVLRAVYDGPVIIPTPSWGTLHDPVEYNGTPKNGGYWYAFPYLPGGRTNFNIIIKTTEATTVNLKLGRIGLGYGGVLTNHFDIYDADWHLNQTLAYGDNKFFFNYYSDIVGGEWTAGNYQSSTGNPVVGVPAIVIDNISKIESVQLLFQERNPINAQGYGYSFDVSYNKTDWIAGNHVKSFTLSHPTYLYNPRYCTQLYLNNTTTQGDSVCGFIVSSPNGAGTPGFYDSSGLGAPGWEGAEMLHYNDYDTLPDTFNSFWNFAKLYCKGGPSTTQFHTTVGHNDFAYNITGQFNVTYYI